MTSNNPSQECVANSIGMKLKLIPSGEFLMGEPQHRSASGILRNIPRRRVQVTQPFHLGVYPVTQDEYQSVIGVNPSVQKGDGRLPVDSVTWFEAIEFCNALSTREGLARYYEVDGQIVSIDGGAGYRLPTEAEWEYACRAGTTSPWSFGDDESLLPEYAWIDDNSSESHPVGMLKPNPWGLYDMHGNVWEWCWDWYDYYLYYHMSLRDPQGPSEGDTRVLRGGSSDDLAYATLSAYRGYAEPSCRDMDSGIRVARTISPDPAQFAKAGGD